MSTSGRGGAGGEGDSDKQGPDDRLGCFDPEPLPQGLMKRKPLADSEGNALGKTLGPVSLNALGIGCIIGAGIFVLTDSIQRQSALNAPSKGRQAR